MASCPACRLTSLIPQDIENSLHVRACTRCSGVWIPLESYATWCQTQPLEPITETIEEPHPHDASGGAALRRCPDCNYILGRYRVGHGATFTIERCANCRGVWLDTDEWQALKSRNLHVRLHGLFDPDWQAKVRRTERQASEIQQLRALLGEADYQRACEFGDWVAAHERKDLIWAVIRSAAGSRPSLESSA